MHLYIFYFTYMYIIISQGILFEVCYYILYSVFLGINFLYINSLQTELIILNNRDMGTKEILLCI